MADLRNLDKHLEEFSYIDGFVLSSKDFELADTLTFEKVEKFLNVSRWFNHIRSFPSERTSRVPNVSTKETSGTMKIDAVDVPHVLGLLSKKDSFNSVSLADELGVPHQTVVGVIKSIQSHDAEMISAEEFKKMTTELTVEGKEMSVNGSSEYVVYQLIGDEGKPHAEVLKLPFGKVGCQKALQNKWVSIDKTGSENKLVRSASPEKVVDSVGEQLKKIKNGEEVAAKEKTELKKRKLINEITIKGLVVSKGPNFSTEIQKPELDLTPEMIQSGSWKNKTFKKYNFEALGVQPSCGHLHPLMKVRAEFRQIFFQMGFSEMKTNRYVESSFWNFDALFQPQQHPARDAHDTFFVSDPALSTSFPPEYLEKVKKVHSEGGFGSIGYNYDWKIEEAQKNVLRTHTTAVSARQLYALAQSGFKDSKMFSIDRVFRNETLDATHLAEFHQVEGVIAEKNLSLAHVMGLFTEFFKKLGIEDLRFKPTYNPYTEPSMEIFAYHKGLKKWVEIGNSGMFRPEMLLPMGLPADVNVAGYGLSLERPTMIRFGIDNIRDLFGPKVDLQMIYDTPICRLDKKNEE